MKTETKANLLAAFLAVAIGAGAMLAPDREDEPQSFPETHWLNLD